MKARGELSGDVFDQEQGLLYIEITKPKMPIAIYQTAVGLLTVLQIVLLVRIASDLRWWWEVQKLGTRFAFIIAATLWLVVLAFGAHLFLSIFLGLNTVLLALLLRGDPGGLGVIPLVGTFYVASCIIALSLLRQSPAGRARANLASLALLSMMLSMQVLLLTAG
jgi:hypothetical protein